MHEKAILHFMIPMAFDALSSLTKARNYAIISWPAYMSLLPLLFQKQENAIKHSIFMVYCICITCVFTSKVFEKWMRSTTQDTKKKSSITWSLIYICILIGVQVYDNFIHRFIFGSQLDFLPLMLYSITTAQGLFAFFCRQFIQYLSKATLKAKKS